MSEEKSNFKVLKYVLYFAVFCLIAGPWLTIFWQEFGGLRMKVWTRFDRISTREDRVL